jgi:hypothetical protein
MMDAEMHQMMLERQERLEEALTKATNGYAVKEDWEIIYAECGLKKPNLKEENHGSYTYT